MQKTSNRNTTAVVGLAAAGLLVYSLFRKASAAGTLNFFVDQVRSLKWSGLTPVVVVGIAVQNTSNQSFSIRSMAGDLLLKSAGQWINIGNVSTFNLTTIPPNSQTTLMVDVRLQLLGATDELIKAITTRNFAQTILFRAMANVDGLQIPMEKQIVIGG